MGERSRSWSQRQRRECKEGELSLAAGSQTPFGGWLVGGTGLVVEEGGLVGLGWQETGRWGWWRSKGEEGGGQPPQQYSSIGPRQLAGWKLVGRLVEWERLVGVGRLLGEGRLVGVGLEG